LIITKQEERDMSQPLAYVLRPKTIDEVVGQEHLVGQNKPLRKLIELDNITSCILYGHAGCGKTTLAHVISHHTKSEFISLNAVSATVKEVRAIGEKARKEGRRILFIDEVYRFNKKQQAVLLPYLEEGSVIFIGATTENPFHSLIPALVSRSSIFELEPLSEMALGQLIVKAVDYYATKNKKVSVEPDAAKYIIRVSSGDARRCLTTFELAVELSVSNHVDLVTAKEAAPNKYMVFSEDLHFDYASAMQGSIQASDADAAVYWLARWLESGEDPRYIARRIMVSASEDAAGTIEAAILAHSSYESACNIGRPECDIIMSHAVVTIASAPRDKSAAKAIWSAVSDVKHSVDIWVPKDMRDCHYPGAEKLGNGAYKDGMNQQQYAGINKQYYFPKEK
jgi:putative ATPase